MSEILEARPAAAWLELHIVAQARNGRQAIEQFEQHQPTICFLDVHMPGQSGLDVARHIGKRSHLVFVTPFNQYALDAFVHGVLDYLVKLVSAARLGKTVERLKARWQTAQRVALTEALLAHFAEQLELEQPDWLRWVRATVGASLRMIPVDDIDFLKSDTKYTLVVYRDEGQPCEALFCMPLKDLIAQRDAQQFAQVHRFVVVNLRPIRRVTRGENETASVELKGRSELLPVSRSYLHLFKEM